MQHLDEVEIKVRKHHIEYISLADLYGNEEGSDDNGCEVDCNDWNDLGGDGDNGPTGCPVGQIYNVVTGKCEITKPYLGDPVKNPEIVSSGASGKRGGTFGCTRTDNTTCGGAADKKNHDGLDIKAVVNTNAFAMHTGTVSSIRNTFNPGEYKKNSYGNFVVITTVINGNTYNVKYNHLNTVSVTAGQTINVGDVIGTSGNTGNANPPNSSVISHIHLQVSNSNWSQKLNPEDYLLTKFDSNYNPISNNCQ